MADKTITTRTETELSSVASLVQLIAERCISPIDGTKIDCDVSLMADLIDQYATQKRAQIKKIIKETLDSPTFIEPKANCRNLTNALQRIETLL